MTDPTAVDVWVVRWPDFDAAQLNSCLSEDERSRADRFTNSDARGRFVIARGLLRAIIGRQLGVHPTELAFASLSTGKPVLAAPGDRTRLTFSLSHADQLGLIAVAHEHAVGVDVERPRANLTMEPLAERFFAPAEAARLRATPEDERAEAFLKLWTAKEALIKAQGETVPTALRRYQLALLDDGSISLARIGGNTDAARPWHLETVRLDDDHRAAVAVETPDAEIRWQRLSRVPRQA